jgi:ABC-type glycerol-3-phosphate transport system substrate-binding protein
MNGFSPQRFLLGLLPFLALLQGCKMPLLQEYIGERSKSIGFGSSIRVLVQTRAGGDPLDQKIYKSIINEEIREFQRFNPNIKIHARFVPFDHLERELGFQHSRGLGPALILLTNNNALPLLRKKYIKDISLNSIELRSVRNALLPSFRHNGKLLGIPVHIYPQLACYDRSRLKKPPESLDELIRLSEAGHSFGIEKNIDTLQWLYTGLGYALFEPKTQTSSLAFLRWLNLANLQPTISFESDPLLLRSGLISGAFSWITCSGSWLPGLKLRMGNNFGVVMLPNMPAGKANPFLKPRTWFFGSQSSMHQQELAKRFALFTVNTVQQRNTALKLVSVAPVNPGISLPLKINKTLKLVNLAAGQGKLLTLGQVDWLYSMESVFIPYLDLVLSGERSPEVIAPSLDNLLEYKAIQ